jgi:hypothetical protein
MRKVNKMLMATVSILLCLVLISTSVVSGIYAKFVTTKSGDAIVSLKAFGVTLSVSPGTNLPAGTVVSPTQIDANTLSVTVTGMQLAPGDFVDDVVIFQVGGTPNVSNVDFKLNVDIPADGSYWLGVDADLPGITVTGPTDYYSPIGFTVKTAEDSERVFALHPWEVVGTNVNYRSAIAQGIIDNLRSLGFTGYSNTITSRIWNKDSTALKFNYLSFGFNCYLDGPPNAPAGRDPENEAEAHMIQTYLQAQENSATITVTYTVTLEQGF